MMLFPKVEQWICSGSREVEFVTGEVVAGPSSIRMLG